MRGLTSINVLLTSATEEIPQHLVAGHVSSTVLSSKKLNLSVSKTVCEGAGVLLVIHECHAMDIRPVDICPLV